MSKSTQTRYAVVTASTERVVKNASTRELAREWKRNQSNPSKFRIFDRQLGDFVR